jgi:hypothetical protein
MSCYEILSLVIQVVTAVALVLTFIVYARMLSTMRQQLRTAETASTAQNTLALAAFLQSEDVRLARAHVLTKLAKKPFAKWSKADRTLASRVCANYGTAAVVLRGNLIPLPPFIQGWGPSIRACFKILRPLIDDLRSPENFGPDYWQDFGWLHARALEAPTLRGA